MSRLYRIIVIPVTGHDKLDTIVPYLAKQRSAFDEVQLWMNTLDVASFGRCNQAAAVVNWISLVPTTVPINGVDSIYAFYKSCTAPDAAYLQLNQDIVWIEDGFSSTLPSYAKRPLAAKSLAHSARIPLSTRYASHDSTERAHQPRLMSSEGILTFKPREPIEPMAMSLSTYRSLSISPASFQHLNRSLRPWANQYL